MHGKLIVMVGLFVAATLSIAAVAKADPIKVPPISVTASATASGSSPANAADGSSSTLWDSGAYAPQWIQLDLGRTVSLQKIRLLPYGTASTSHRIYVGITNPPTRQVASVNRYTVDGQWVEVPTPVANVRYIRVITQANGTNRVSWREIEAVQNLEYFGYYADGCQTDMCPAEGDNIQATAAAGANLHMVARLDDPANPFTATFNPNVWLPFVQEAKNAGGKAVLSLTPQLYDASHRLRADWQSQWAAILDFIKNTAPANSIAALYPFDEPYNIGWVVPGPAQVASDLRTLTDKMHADTLAQLGYRMPIASFFAVTEVDCGPTTCPKSMFDWIGFDCYAPWGNCRGHVMDYWIDKLNSELQSGQRLIIAPPAYHGDANELATVQDILTDINYWHMQVLSNPTYIAVFPFRWGVLQEPVVKDRLIQFNDDVVHPGSKNIHVVFPDASAYVTGGEPFLAFDSDHTGDLWNSGGNQPQSIVAGLGGNTRVNNVTLRVAQHPAGPTVHNLNGYVPGTGWTTLATFSSNTEEGQVLTWSGTADVTQISVVTTVSPASVAWHDIQISRN